MRLLRLGMGIYAGVYAVQGHDYVLGFLSAMFLLQAATNTGCCGTSCAPITNNKTTTATEDIHYEEIKQQ